MLSLVIDDGPNLGLINSYKSTPDAILAQCKYAVFGPSSKAKLGLSDRSRRSLIL
jgi:hypothetical protein